MSPDTRAPEYKEADRRTARDRPAGQPVVATPQARQGVTGHNARYVLVFGTVAVIVAFIIIYLIYFG